MLRGRISSGITGAVDVGLGPLERHIPAEQCPGDLQKLLDAMLWWPQCRLAGLNTWCFFPFPNLPSVLWKQE